MSVLKVGSCNTYASGMWPLKQDSKPAATSIPPRYNGRVRYLRLFRDPCVAQKGTWNLVSGNLVREPSPPQPSWSCSTSVRLALFLLFSTLLKASGYITPWQLGNFSSLFSLWGFQLWLWNSHSLSIIISTSNAHYTFLGTWNQLKSTSSVLINSAFFGRTQTIFQRKDKRESKPYWQSQIQCGLWLGVGLERSEAKKEAEFIKTVGIPLFNLFLAASKSWIVWIKRKLNIPFMFIIHITKKHFT